MANISNKQTDVRPARRPPLFNNKLLLCALDLPTFPPRIVLKAKERKVGAKAQRSNNSLRGSENIQINTETTRMTQKQEACRLEVENVTVQTR